MKKILVLCRATPGVPVPYYKLHSNITLGESQLPSSKTLSYYAKRSLDVAANLLRKRGFNLQTVRGYGYTMHKAIPLRVRTNIGTLDVTVPLFNYNNVTVNIILDELVKQGVTDITNIYDWAPAKDGYYGK